MRVSVLVLVLGEVGEHVKVRTCSGVLEADQTDVAQSVAVQVIDAFQCGERFRLYAVLDAEELQPAQVLIFQRRELVQVHQLQHRDGVGQL